jgi:hypothetical protein
VTGRTRKLLIGIAAGACLRLALTTPLMVRAGNQSVKFEQSFGNYSAAILGKYFQSVYDGADPDFKIATSYTSFLEPQQGLIRRFGDLNRNHATRTEVGGERRMLVSAILVGALAFILAYAIWFRRLVLDFPIMVRLALSVLPATFSIGLCQYFEFRGGAPTAELEYSPWVSCHRSPQYSQPWSYTTFGEMSERSLWLNFANTRCPVAFCFGSGRNGVIAD